MKRFNFKWLNSGYCKHPEFVTIQGGSFKAVEYPSFFGLLIHPVHGIILYDSGYSNKFKEVTQSFPERFYSMVTPVCCNSSEQAKEQLKIYGLNAADVRYIIISHFHADHICGLSDFPNAKFVCNTDELDSLLSKSKIKQVYNGFLANLLPKNFLERTVSIKTLTKVSSPALINEFEDVFDLFGDKSLLIVAIPGHTNGQIGILFKNSEDQDLFLIGDAVWDTRTILENRLPFIVAQKYSQNQKKYLDTIKKLQRINPSDLLLIPSHCKMNKGKFE